MIVLEHLKVAGKSLIDDVLQQLLRLFAGVKGRTLQDRR